MARTQAILFDIDGTLIESGGSSDRAWHRAFEELHGADVQISKVTGKGVPDPAVGRQAFEAVIGREPTDEEMARLMAKRLEYLPQEVESSDGYKVMPGTEELLERLIDDGYLLGLTPATSRAPPTSSSRGPTSTASSRSGGTAPIPMIGGS